MISRGYVVERRHLKYGLVNLNSLSCTRFDMVDSTQPQHEYTGTGECWNIVIAVIFSCEATQYPHLCVCGLCVLSFEKFGI